MKKLAFTCGRPVPPSSALVFNGGEQPKYPLHQRDFDAVGMAYDICLLSMTIR